MGIKAGHTINYIINDLSLNDLIEIAKSRRKVSCDVDASLLSGPPVIDIDASWIVRRYMNVSDDCRINYLMKLCLLLLKEGCCVNIVCDGDKRHHTKRSTTKRLVDCYRNKMDYHLMKCKLSSLVDDVVEEAEIRKKLNSMEKKVSEVFVDVGNKLFDEIQARISKLKEDRNSNLIYERLTVEQAEFQADTVIAYRTTRSMNHLVFTSDLDQAIHCGAMRVCVKEFTMKLNNKTDVLEKIGIFCT